MLFKGLSVVMQLLRNLFLNGVAKFTYIHACMQSDLRVPEDSLATRMHCLHFFPSVAIFLFEYRYIVLFQHRLLLIRYKIQPGRRHINEQYRPDYRQSKLTSIYYMTNITSGEMEDCEWLRSTSAKLIENLKIII
jgi:hypothetical protein